MKRSPTDSNTEGKKDTGMLKYIRNQVNCLESYLLLYLMEEQSVIDFKDFCTGIFHLTR